MLTARQYHDKHHRWADGFVPQPEDCSSCIEAKYRCREKVLYKSRDKAERKALEVNIERNWYPGECLIPYRCRYCHNWHTTHAKRREQRSRVEKMRLRWLRTQRKRKKIERELWFERDYLEGRAHFDTHQELFDHLYPEPEVPEEWNFEWDDELIDCLDGDEDDA